MLILPCGMYIFASAQTAISVAVKVARVPHGRKACIYGWLACAFGRLCRPKAPLRETFDRSSPSSMRRGGASLHGSLTFAPPAVKVILSTPHYNRALNKLRGIESRIWTSLEKGIVWALDKVIASDVQGWCNTLGVTYSFLALNTLPQQAAEFSPGVYGISAQRA